MPLRMTTKSNLNDDQTEVFKALQKFIKHQAASTFVLKGYAGTGKTFLMQHLAKWLESNDYAFSLLASTGRAATILRGKTGYGAKTVHGELYQFNKVDGDEEHISEDAPIEQYGQMTLQFALRTPDQSKHIYIIDESSMLSSELPVESTTVFFGSGYLLIDFFEAIGSNKIIFVGDPGQLPPVGQLFSPALDMDWLAQQKRMAITMTLQKIERQNADNDLLILASDIRNMKPDPDNRFIKIPAKNRNNTTIYPSQQILFNEYVKKFKEVGTNETLAIARSNKMVSNLNRAVRRDLHGKIDLPIQGGEILMVIQNNYSVPLTNGDFITVIELGSEYLQNGLHFRTVKVKAHSSEEEFELLLSLDILYSKHINFTKEQSKHLMVEFSRKMKKKGLKPNSPEYKQEMMKEPYLNCLRAKYGYAVTCHKSQGGEWNDVFLFLDRGMYRMEHQELFRWWYTAVTRAKKQLHLYEDWWIC